MLESFKTYLAIVVLLCPSFLPARGDTVGIIISAPEFVMPIRLTEGVGRFHVWAGPGTSGNESQSMIVDWQTGGAEPPRAEPVYQVTIETNRRNPSSYVVLYTIDSSSGKGYVYIPGRSHPAYKDNTWLIHRGVEGQWFRAWSEWESVANPLIAQAARIR